MINLACVGGRGHPVVDNRAPIHSIGKLIFLGGSRTKGSALSRMLPVIFLSVLGSALAENCTSDGEIQADNCVPQIIMDYKTIFIFNIVIIILIGTFGNLLTLLALPYARNYYHKRFSLLTSSTTILLLHLALCDLCYLIFGLPVQASILNDGRLK